MNLTRRHLMRTAAISGATLALPAPALPQQGVIRVICPATVGGSTDLFARVFASAFAEQIGQSVIVENRLGAGGLIAAESVVRAPPDGRTIMFHSVSSAVTSVLTRKVRPYHPVDDFAWIAMLGVVPQALGITDSLPARNLPEFVSLLKSSPGKYSYGSAGTGSSTHLAAELFKQVGGGLDVVHVPYPGAAPAMNDTVTGIVAFTMDAIGSILAQQRPGGLRIIAVLGDTRSPFAPDIPTAREQGLNFTAETFNPVALPKGTPTEIVSRYAETTRRALQQPETLARLKNIGIQPLLDSTPEHCRRLVEAEVVKWTPIVAKLGLG